MRLPLAHGEGMTDRATSVVPLERIQGSIFLIRGHKVMLSMHLAALYGVEPRVLVQAVKRNLDRFPADFMFQLTPEEFGNLKSQFVISSWGGLRRATPYAFTEQGVAMLASVLRSQQAVCPLFEPRVTSTNHDSVFDAIRQLMAPPKVQRQRIGFGGER